MVLSLGMAGGCELISVALLSVGLVAGGSRWTVGLRVSGAESASHAASQPVVPA